MLDLRLPSGLFFAIAGAILLVLGVIDPESRAPLTPLNINLYEGVVMLAFGAFLLLLSLRASRRA